MKLRRRATGILTAALMIAGITAPVASAQAERVITPEQHDAYVQEFQQDPVRPPVVDGVGGYTDDEVAEIQEAIRQAENSGPPKDELVPGEMWSDKVDLPARVDKATADESEIKLSQERSRPQARGLAAAAQCQSFWLSPYQVCGAILERYNQLGGATSWLLAPIENQTLNPDGQGYRQRFMNGFIYYHPTTGAHAVTNRNAQVWERNGWESGWMGYPTGGEVPVTGSTPIEGEANGWVQTFQGGRIYRSQITNGFQVASINGLILDKWLEEGGPSGALGFPIADEAGTPDSLGRFSVFQWGSLYWSPTSGAHAVYGPVLEKWAENGYENGSYGYPISDITGEITGEEHQEFQGGRISSGPEITGVAYTADGKEVGENYDDMWECVGGYDTGRLTFFHKTGQNLYCKDFRHIFARHMPNNLTIGVWRDFQVCVAATLASSERWEPNEIGTYGRTRYNTYTKTRSWVVVWNNSNNVRTAYTSGEGGREWSKCRYLVRP
ncbi:LGFP repeat-containing protein [Corynebacterium pacaense]|uniref:LGFP repeat-containing protein n=1 Tax=Corynebacterium pacaense TaxID=1816684 RepID=UPI0011787C72|nr:LGFP repeat-containing protein [Corynebacterium pacaense]